MTQPQVLQLPLCSQALLSLQKHDHAVQDNHDNLSPRRVLPGLLKRTLHYIKTNLGQTLSMDELVKVSGASRRSLEQAFRLNLQTSPMRYILHYRLHAAHESLRQAQPGEIQLAVLAKHLGFNQPSHFTHAYKKRFGELPSDTLAR